MPASLGSLTSANAVLQLSIDVIFPTPQQIQQFTTDNIYDAPQVKPTITKMGVDGKQSAGFIFVSKEIMIHLMPNSPSQVIFDTWATNMEAQEDVYSCSGLIVLKSTGRKFTLIDGSLTTYTPLPGAGQVLKDLQHGITFGKIIPAAA
jgi:hypothetical protein